MDLEKLEKMVQLVLKDLSYYDSYSDMKYHPELEAEIKNLMKVSSKTLPDHQDFFYNVYKSVHFFNIRQTCSAIKHFLEILEIEKASESKIKEMKIFESAEDKMKQAGLCLRKDDYTSSFHNLNTALELVLKDRLGIPTTITKINTSKIIDILVKHKVEPYLYLSEAKKRVLVIDNKIKHQGYAPTKIDCINAIKGMEELISKLREKEIKLTEEIRNKIYQGL